MIVSVRADVSFLPYLIKADMFSCKIVSTTCRCTIKFIVSVVTHAHTVT